MSIVQQLIVGLGAMATVTICCTVVAERIENKGLWIWFITVWVVLSMFLFARASQIGA